MKNNGNDVSVLNDLVQINNDRVTGYKKAIDELNGNEADLVSVFNEMIGHSEEHLSDLKEMIGSENGTPEEGTTVSGKIYRVWMDIKATFSGNDRKAALESCEFGEDAAQKAYEKALAEDLSVDARQLVAEQKTSLKKDHDKIKQLRDAKQPA